MAAVGTYAIVRCDQRKDIVGQELRKLCAVRMRKCSGLHRIGKWRVLIGAASPWIVNAHDDNRFYGLVPDQLRQGLVDLPFVPESARANIEQVLPIEHVEDWVDPRRIRRVVVSRRKPHPQCLGVAEGLALKGLYAEVADNSGFAILLLRGERLNGHEGATQQQKTNNLSHPSILS